MKTSARRVELLKAAAEALRDGRNPFSDGFLADRKVTFDEAMMLSESLATGVELLLELYEQMNSGDKLVRSAAQSRLVNALARGIA